MDPTADVLTGLRAMTLNVLARHVREGDEVALLDFPRHLNAGDSVIWLGAETYLRRLGAKVGYIASLHHFDASELRRRVPLGPILINGGGNFGDRWPLQQAFRERVISQFPDRHIIQLPQSFDFQTDTGLTAAKSVIDKHERLTILLRDLDSTERARGHFPNADITFCPDVGLGYEPLLQRSLPRRSVVSLIRNDRESTNSEAIPVEGGIRTDWNDNPFDRLEWRLNRVGEDASRVMPAMSDRLYNFTSRGLGRMATRNAERAADLVASGHALVTNRLHGVILGALLRVPVFAFDNATSKVSRLINEYLGSLPGVSLAGSAQEATTLASSAIASGKS